MTRSRRLFLFLLYDLLFLPVARAEPAQPPSSPSSSIAVVDIEYIHDHAKEMASIREQVENLRAAYQEEIATLERQLREERQFLDGDRGTLSSEEREVRERTFESKEEHLRQLVRRLKTQLERALESAKEEFLKHFQSVVSQIARTHHLSLVVIKSAAPYASEECDITRQVLERLDATAQPITLSPTKEEKVEKSSP